MKRFQVCQSFSSSCKVRLASTYRLSVSYHADELYELQSHCDLHSLAEVVHRSDHLVVAGEQGFHQTALIIRADRWTYRTHRHTTLISLIVHNKISQRVTDGI